MNQARTGSNQVHSGALRWKDGPSWVCILALLAVFSLAACAANSPTTSTDRPSGLSVETAPDSTLATLQLADAMKLVAAQNWPQALAALRAIIEARTFKNLPGDLQYKILSSASRVAIYHGPPRLGYGYLGRVIAMPQAEYGDWLERLREAEQSGKEADSVRTLTVLMQRWPDGARQIDPDNILKIANEARQLPRDAALPLLQALYDAHWTLKWDIESSETWRDLTRLLLEQGRLPQAIGVSAHITDVYVLIAMRADRRFDAVIAASPAQFDIEAAAEREFQAFQAGAEKAPQSLELKSWVINSLLRQRHYGAALAASDSILLDIRSTNYPGKLYEDYDDEHSWFLNLRSIALQRVGRWDEAVAQLTEASLLYEKYGGNVDQLINLGDLYCALGRPKDALSTVGSVVAGVSPLGAMQMEAVRVDASDQLRDFKQVERSLHYLRVHRAVAPDVYEDALIAVNQLDRAAQVLIAELLDKDQRQDALLGVQVFAPTPGTPRDMDWDVRRRQVIARPEVQAAIQKVGRVESYRLEEP